MITVPCCVFVYNVQVCVYVCVCVFVRCEVWLKSCIAIVVRCFVLVV